jgi:hypothetical protein
MPRHLGSRKVVLIEVSVHARSLRVAVCVVSQGDTIQVQSCVARYSRATIYGDMAQTHKILLRSFYVSYITSSLLQVSFLVVDLVTPACGPSHCLSR